MNGAPFNPTVPKESYLFQVYDFIIAQGCFLNLEQESLFMERPAFENEPQMRIVGRSTSLQEANLLAQQYEMRGFTTSIIKKKQGEITLYEVWAGKKPDILSAEASPRL